MAWRLRRDLRRARRAPCAEDRRPPRLPNVPPPCGRAHGQLLNLSQLGADAGITHNTAKSWLSILEACYLAIRLPPFFRNLGKRLAKTPKLHFADTGLVCHLLGIRTASELRHHPPRGAIFESWVVSEVRKAHLNAGMLLRLSFFRDAHGLEVDLLIERGAAIDAVEVKSGATVPLDAFAPIKTLGSMLSDLEGRYVVHDGADSFRTSDGQAISFRATDELAP